MNIAALSTANIVLAWSVATVVAAVVFTHATKHGSKHATAWGIGTFLLMIVVLPAYVLHVWRRKPSGPKRRY
ncbi:MAG: hypothetical protein QOD92_2423 [Acidimicrobiaceae bacterium]|jgi:hypothetical protein